MAEEARELSFSIDEEPEWRPELNPEVRDKAKKLRGILGDAMADAGLTVDSVDQLGCGIESEPIQTDS